VKGIFVLVLSKILKTLDTDIEKKSWGLTITKNPPSEKKTQRSSQQQQSWGEGTGT